MEPTKRTPAFSAASEFSFVIIIIFRAGRHGPVPAGPADPAGKQAVPPLVPETGRAATRKKEVPWEAEPPAGALLSRFSDRRAWLRLSHFRFLMDSCPACPGWGGRADDTQLMRAASGGSLADAAVRLALSQFSDSLFNVHLPVTDGQCHDLVPQVAKENSREAGRLTAPRISTEADSAQRSLTPESI